jgi:hypothetical protein
MSTLLPEPGSVRPVPLRPAPSDEGRHAVSSEEWFNESWYFDGVSDDATLGVYWRLGRVPNQGVAIVSACIVGPRRPCVMLVRDVELPDFDDDQQRVSVDGLEVSHHCEEPLKRYRVRLEGVASSLPDAAGVFREEAGEPVPIEFDLVWETDGVPYQWRQSTRYEIPCSVSGRVRVGEEEIAFSGPGQRDHSWGARDWFAVDWIWSGLHLSDGTHVHAVGVPQIPGYGVGDRVGDRFRNGSGRWADRARVGSMRSRRALDGDRAAGVWADPAEGPRRTGVAIPALHVPGPLRGRAHRQRLGRVEPGPAGPLTEPRAQSQHMLA